MPRKKQPKEITYRDIIFQMPQGYQEIIDKIVEQHHTTKRSLPEKWKIKYYFVIDYIVSQYFSYRSDKELDKRYFCINAQAMDKILGLDTLQMALVMKHIKQAKLLECDNIAIQASFVAGKSGKKFFDGKRPGKSYGYRIPNYSKCTLVNVTVAVLTQDADRLKVKKSHLENQSEEVQLYSGALKHISIDTSNPEKTAQILQSILNNKQSKLSVQSNYNKYISNYLYTLSTNYCNEYYTLVTVAVPNSVSLPNEDLPASYGLTVAVPIYCKSMVYLGLQQDDRCCTPAETDDKTILRFERTIREINNQEQRVARPIKHSHSRVYCTLSNMNRELRKLVLIEGKQMLGIDIRNSQPLIAAYLFKLYYERKELPIPEDVKQYQEDCQNGIFYNYFMDKINLPDEFRTEFKKDFFQKVFFSKLSPIENFLKTMFIEKYPNVWKVITEEKGGYIWSRDNGLFANRCTIVEADIIFDKVNIQLIKRGIIAYNNYDSIYVNSDENFEIAKAMVMDEFAKLGLYPTINKEDYRDREVSELQILNEIENEAVCQDAETEEEIGYLKQRVKYIIKEEFITPYDNSGNLWGHIEPFKYFGYTVQTVKYFIENYKVDEIEAQEIYHGQFKEIESMAA